MNCKCPAEVQACAPDTTWFRDRARLLMCKPHCVLNVIQPERGCLAEVQACAQRATSFVEGVVSETSGGLPAYVRTIAHCGHLGTVAMSMLGEYAVGLKMTAACEPAA